MKKRRKSSPKKRRAPGRYGMELAVLCVLLMVAAYVGSQSRPAQSPSSRPVQAVKAGTEQRRPAVSDQEKASNTRQQSAERQEKIMPQRPPSEKKDTGKKLAAQQNGQEKNTGLPEEKKSARAAAAGKSAPAADQKEYRLLYVADGDSFELKDGSNRKLRVRLYGVDAPEGRQRFGRESRAHLIKLMQGHKLRLKTMYLDNYQRSVAIVYIVRDGKTDELSINQRQIQEGMAWVYDYFCTSAICNTWKLEEAMAQKQKLGLWKDGTPVPPWQWRRANPRQ